MHCVVALHLYIYTLSRQLRKNIYHIYKLKEGSSRLDRNITGIKKPLIVTVALRSCYIMPEYERCEDNNVGANKLALLQT